LGVYIAKPLRLHRRKKNPKAKKGKKQQDSSMALEKLSLRKSHIGMKKVKIKTGLWAYTAFGLTPKRLASLFPHLEGLGVGVSL
jgi:hypothetical protein